MKIVLIGIQGAGKSTQGNLLSEKYSIPYLSSGHIFRQMARSKSKLGRWLKETLNSGALVPDNTTTKIMFEYLEKPIYQKGYILDGFPRTLTQAKAFLEQNGIDKFVFIDVSDKEALWRISGRESDREDESLHAIRKRITLFHDMTTPVIDFYKKKDKLVKVDGEQDVNGVFKQICKLLDK